MFRSFILLTAITIYTPCVRTGTATAAGAPDTKWRCDGHALSGIRTVYVCANNMITAMGLADAAVCEDALGIRFPDCWVSCQNTLMSCP